MKPQNSFRIVSIVVVSLKLSCGTKNDSAKETTVPTASTSQVLESSALQGESANMSLTETLDTLADAEIGAGSSSLALGETLALADANSDVNKTKICELVGNAAKVTISRDINRTITSDRAKWTYVRTVTGSSDVVRTWSNPTAAITCDAKKDHANIKWDATIANTTLAVTVDRTLKRTTKGTKKNSDKIVEETYESASKGSRTILWKSHTTNTDGTFTRVKTVKLSIDRSQTLSGQKVAYTFSTPDDAPLEETVIRDSKTRDLKSKTITSGSLVAKKDDLKIVTSFDKFRIDFTSTKCLPASGSLTMKFYKADATTPSKIWTLTVASNDFTVQDVTDSKNPVTVDDFDYTECNLADFSPE